MRNQGIIKHAMISFSISDHNQESNPYALFGQNNYSQIVGGKDGLFTYKSIKNPYQTWAVGASNLYYGTKPIGKDSSYIAVVDTGSSHIVVPPSFFEKLKASWKRDVPDMVCNDVSCNVMGSCADVAKKLKPVGFLLNDRVFSITSDTYLFQGRLHGKDNC